MQPSPRTARADEGRSPSSIPTNQAFPISGEQFSGLLLTLVMNAPDRVPSRTQDQSINTINTVSKMSSTRFLLSAVAVFAAAAVSGRAHRMSATTPTTNSHVFRRSSNPKCMILRLALSCQN